MSHELVDSLTIDQFVDSGADEPLDVGFVPLCSLAVPKTYTRFVDSHMLKAPFVKA